MPGIFAVMSRCDSVTVKPASVLSNVTVAVALMEVGVKPALPSSAEKAMAKQPACAAAMSSSGLVPTPFSNRDQRLRVLEHTAIGGNIAFASFQIAVPDGGCFAFNSHSNLVWFVETGIRSSDGQTNANLRKFKS